MARIRAAIEAGRFPEMRDALRVRAGRTTVSEAAGERA
jgi:hypothetical protein